MSDRRLRELERRFRETGALSDEAAWAVARARAGQLGHEGLRLAAYLGSEPAQHALGDDARTGDEDVRWWLWGLSEWSRPIAVFGAVAAARSALPVWASTYPNDTHVAAAIEAAERWARKPSAEHSKEAGERANRINWHVHEWPGPLRFARRSALAAARAAEHANNEGTHYRSWLRQAAQSATEATSEQDARASVVEALMRLAGLEP